jgi:phosphoribosyl-ATP pyrophosphohydrolase
MNNFTLKDLENIIKKRKDSSNEKSYTASLLNSPVEKIIKKIGEESAELIFAATQKNKKKMIHEFADVIYHLFVLSRILNISVDDIMNELFLRTKSSGLVEKKNRKK